MPYLPHLHPMRPWTFADDGVYPCEPAAGLRAEAVRLGTWQAPHKFPWDVSVVRTRWRDNWRTTWATCDPSQATSADAEPDVNPTGGEHQHGLTWLFPSLLLIPRACLLPENAAAEAFSTWKTAVAKAPRLPGWSPKTGRLTWDIVSPAPTSIQEVWERSIDLANLEDETQRTPRELRERLKRMWWHTPWVFALSLDLIRALGRELRLPGPLDPEDVLVAARGADQAGWLSADIPPRHGPPEIRWKRAGAYEYLTGEGHRKTTVAAFLDGKGTPKMPMKRSTTSKEYGRWLDTLDSHGIEPYLVPLAFESLWDDEPDIAQWTVQWLRDGRARRGMWRAFGRSIRHFKFDLGRGGDTPPAKDRAGLRGFSLVPGLSVEPSAGHRYNGWHLRWTPPDLNVQDPVAPNSADGE